MANPPQWSLCPRNRFGVHQTDPKMAPPRTRRCKKDAWKIPGPKNELKTGAAWRPHPYTYFVLTDPFRGPPGGPQNGAAPNMAIPKTWLGQSPKMKAGPKREPPGGPNSGSAKSAANPTKGLPHQDQNKTLLWKLPESSRANLKQNKKPKTIQPMLVSRKTPFCCSLPGSSKCTKRKWDLKCSPAVQDAGNRFPRAAGLCPRLEQPKRIHFETLSHVFFEIPPNSEQKKVLTWCAAHAPNTICKPEI